jgi:hypothetical protein
VAQCEVCGNDYDKAVSSGPRMARSTHLTASNAPFISSLRDVSTVVARRAWRGSRRAHVLLRALCTTCGILKRPCNGGLCQVAVFD